MSLSSAQATISAYKDQRKAQAASLVAIMANLRSAKLTLSSLISSGASYNEIQAQADTVTTLKTQYNTERSALKELNASYKAAVQTVQASYNVTLPPAPARNANLFMGPVGATGPMGPPPTATVDSTPTSGASTHLISSGGVYQSLQSIGPSSGGSSGAVNVGTSSGGDPDVILQCNFDTDTTDTSYYQNKGTFNQFASYTTAQSAYGGGFGSAAFTLAGGSATYDTSVAIGTSPFTFECWVNFSALGGTDQYIMSAGTVSSSAIELIVQTSGTVVKINYLGTAYTCSYTFATGNWYHIAVVKSNNTTLLLFVNGTLQKTFTLPSTGITKVLGVTLGESCLDYTKMAKACLNGVRLSTKAQYTSPFTPPSVPFSSASPVRDFPANPVVGQLWSDGSTLYLRQSNNTWATVSSSS